LSREERLQGLHWQCFACGPDNPRGLGLEIRIDGDHARTEFVPTAEYQGPPGLVHSGVTAAILDEVMTQLLYARLELVATRKIEVQYRLPLRVGQRYYFKAWLERSAGRIILCRAECADGQGRNVARARGVFARLEKEAAARLLEPATPEGGAQV
jgi:acyl-coenzyme A thioesterase PaaI-like protein